jgi:hypothetical protein
MPTKPELVFWPFDGWEYTPICVQPITLFFFERVVGSDLPFQKASERVATRAGTGFFGLRRVPKRFCDIDFSVITTASQNPTGPADSFTIPPKRQPAAQEPSNAVDAAVADPRKSPPRGSTLAAGRSNS